MFPSSQRKKAAEAAYSLHVLFFVVYLLLVLFGKTPELGFLYSSKIVSSRECFRNMTESFQNAASQS